MCKFKQKKHQTGIALPWNYWQGLNNKKEFWKFIKPFLTNKGFLESNDITLKEKTGLITSEAKLSEDFHDYYENSWK